MNKGLLLSLLTFITIQAADTPVVVEQQTEEDAIVQLQKVHADIALLKTEVIAILLALYERLDAIKTTRGLNFGAWNNLHEYEKYQDSANSEDEEYNEEDYSEEEQE